MSFTEEKMRRVAEIIFRLPVDFMGIMPFEGLLSYHKRLTEESNNSPVLPQNTETGSSEVDVEAS